MFDTIKRLMRKTCVAGRHWLSSLSVLFPLVPFYYYTFGISFFPKILFFYATLAFCAGALLFARWRCSWVLAMVSVFILGMLPSLTFNLFSFYWLAIYLGGYLLALLVYGYLVGWPEVALFGFGCYMFYHPILFAVVSDIPKKGLLTLSDALMLLGGITVCFSAIPWLYNCIRPRFSAVDVALVALSGTYCFAAIRLLLRDQLRLTEQFHILRVLYRPPSYRDLLLMIFMIYGLYYLALFLIGFLLRKRNGVQACLLTLAIIASIGTAALYNRKKQIAWQFVKKSNTFYKKYVATKKQPATR